MARDRGLCPRTPSDRRLHKATGSGRADGAVCAPLLWTGRGLDGLDPANRPPFHHHLHRSGQQDRRRVDPGRSQALWIGTPFRARRWSPGNREFLAQGGSSLLVARHELWRRRVAVRAFFRGTGSHGAFTVSICAPRAAISPAIPVVCISASPSMLTSRVWRSSGPMDSSRASSTLKPSSQMRFCGCNVKLWRMVP